MINFLLGAICIAMVVLFVKIIYECGYKKGCDSANNEYKGCLSKVRDLNALMASRLAKRFAKNRTYKR